MASFIQHLNELVYAGAIGCIFAILVFFTKNTWKKSNIESGLSIASHSGDSEQMTFTANFFKNESKKQKQEKIDELFSYIAKRRKDTHEEFLRVREEAIRENEMKDPSELKLRSATEKRVIQ